jgi:mRNA interferase MazF
MNRNLDTIVVCPLTTKLHSAWRSRLQIMCAGKTAEIAIDQIRTISKLRLRRKLDVLPAVDAEKLRQIIIEMYGQP